MQTTMESACTSGGGAEGLSTFESHFVDGGCRPRGGGLKASLMRRVVRQFGRPAGLLGALVGSIMAHKKDSRNRALLTVDRLQIEPTHSVLEIGFGPGIALEEACRRASRGRVVGVDHSAVMVRQAGRRLRKQLETGRLELFHESVSEIALITEAECFDRIFAINSHQFWPEAQQVLEILGSRLRPSGRLALTFQPPFKGATESDARLAGEGLSQWLREAGLAAVRCELFELEGAPAARVVGEREGS